MQPDKELHISLIIPCYNEETNIQKGVLDKIGNFTKDNEKFKEVLIVDDGSVDNSIKIIKQKYLSQFPKFQLIENPHGGKAQAIISGITHAKSDYVLFSDIDLATPLEESENLMAQIKNGYQVVIGSRGSKRTGGPLLRRLMAVGFIVIRNLLIGLKGIKDTQCGFKLFDKEIAQKVISRMKVFNHPTHVSGSSVSAGFDLEFLFLATKLGARIKEIPVTWRHVETKNVDFVKSSIETLKDITTMKYFEITHQYNV